MAYFETDEEEQDAPEVTPEPTPEPEPTPAPDANPNQEQADAIFANMPHVHTIWFDESGAWRFYETPGTTPIERVNKNIDVDITNL